MEEMIIATSIYPKMIALMMRSKRHMAIICEKQNLTPVQGMMLTLFEPNEEKSMIELADIMGCDASNITGLVDRLESHHLIERSSCEKDRRIKMIRLSAKGVECRTKVLHELHNAEVLDFEKLGIDERKALITAIEKLSS